MELKYRLSSGLDHLVAVKMCENEYSKNAFVPVEMLGQLPRRMLTQQGS